MNTSADETVSTCISTYLPRAMERMESLLIQGKNTSLMLHLLDEVGRDCGYEPNYRDLAPYTFWITGILSLLLGLFGLAGNILSIIVLMQKRMSSVFNHLLVLLCCADILVTLTGLIFSFKVLIPGLYMRTVLPISDSLAHVAVTASVFFTVAISLERHTAVCSPLTYQARIVEKGHVCLLVSYSLPVILFSILLNLPRIFAHFPFGQILQADPMYIQTGIYSQIFHPVCTTCILPFISLAVLNYRIFLASRRQGSANNPSDLAMARTMMALVLIFLILNLPRLSLGLYEIPGCNELVNQLCYLLHGWIQVQGMLVGAST
ncbi:FMRFamide receptor isoform X2 [Eurytemora carolleeae]|uniref:FMRFamide receptor isoform X2 n=1 Tax=Eurytemora carolleeae TaxID=1294199 RepID=UPI000C78F84D|nr:FMRFamide receptor isoform X2 [Eurytemora carolleeae]|eukprot:XP_023331090.1 FMRFamide receptor-like isoform X2 [Eurytemora affinis]